MPLMRGSLLHWSEPMADVAVGGSLPNSENARGPPIIGIESRLYDPPKGFPLWTRLSLARSISGIMSVAFEYS